MDKIKKIRGEAVPEGCGVGSQVLVCDVIGRYDFCGVLSTVACVFLIGFMRSQDVFYDTDTSRIFNILHHTRYYH